MGLIEPVAVYTSIIDCLDSATDLKSRYEMINTIINSLLSAMTKAALSSGTMEYQINTGQSIIKVIYRNPSEITNTISVLRREQNEIKRMLYGGVTRLQDSNVRR